MLELVSMLLLLLLYVNGQAFPPSLHPISLTLTHNENTSLPTVLTDLPLLLLCSILSQQQQQQLLLLLLLFLPHIELVVEQSHQQNLVNFGFYFFFFSACSLVRRLSSCSTVPHTSLCLASLSPPALQKFWQLKTPPHSCLMSKIGNQVQSKCRIPIDSQVEREWELWNIERFICTCCGRRIEGREREYISMEPKFNCCRIKLGNPLVQVEFEEHLDIYKFEIGFQQFYIACQFNVYLKVSTGLLTLSLGPTVHSVN